MTVPSVQLGTYTTEVAREIKKRVLEGPRNLPIHRIIEGAVGDMYYAVLTDTLYPATNPLTGWTTAFVRLLRYVGGTSYDMEEVPGDAGLFKIVNRSKDLYGEAPTLVIIKKINVIEWGIIWIDCPESSSSSLSTTTPPP